MLLKLMQSIIDGLAITLIAIVKILPMSPFLAFNEFALDNTLLGVIAWVVPISSIIALLEAWGVSIGLFYLYMIVLRWIKAI